MKHTLLVLFAILGLQAVAQTDTLAVKSKITDITVFFNGAQVSREAPVKTRKGQTLITFDKLPVDVNAQSIQAKGGPNINILSVKLVAKTVADARKSPAEQAVQDKIDDHELKMGEIRSRMEVFDLEERLLMDNSHLSKKDEGTSVAKIKEAADFYRARLNEIRLSKLNLGKEHKAAEQKLQDLYRDLNEKAAARQRGDRS